MHERSHLQRRDDTGTFQCPRGGSSGVALHVFEVMHEPRPVSQEFKRLIDVVVGSLAAFATAYGSRPYDTHAEA